MNEEQLENQVSHYDDDDEKMTEADLARRDGTQLCQRWATEVTTPTYVPVVLVNELPVYMPVVLVDELRLEALRSVGVRHATLFTHAANKIQRLERQLALADKYWLEGNDEVCPWKDVA